MLETALSVFSVFLELGKCLAAPLGRQFGYLRNYKTNFDSLKQEAEKLTDARERVHHRVDDAERQGEEIEQDVLRWLTRVDESIKEADKIIEDEGKVLCFKGLCPNLKTRYQISKDAVRKLSDIKGLREEGKFEVVSYRTLPQEISLPATKGYESFETRMKTMRDIQKALSDPNVRMIGVYGMGGIGKTTLVKEIASQAEKDKLFDEVVFAHVSQMPDIIKIQGEIADKIGLEFREETESGRARKLRERLSGGKKNPSIKEATDLDMERSLDTSSCKVETEAGRNTKQELSREKKVLVILDDIWKHLDLETIGIPLRQNNKGCKVLLTTRNLDVLTDKMCCDHNIQVGSLDEEEAWSLFKKMAGDCTENRDLQPIAIDIAKECRGLPIAIVTVARALRNKRIHQWKSALQDLRNPSERSLTTGVQAEAYSCIELSYKYLEDDELRSAFLLCSLFRNPVEGFYFLDLLKYSIGLGLIQGVKTMEGSRDKLHTLLDKLKASCLLLDGHTSEWFCMHDIVLDVALSIASRDKHVFTVRNEALPITWPNSDALKNCNAIALHENNISELPDGLECPTLDFLLMNCKEYLGKIPNNFFAGMTKLKALGLSRIQLLSLPSSIRLLGNLRTLCLYYSELGDVAIIGELKKLEILVFRGSNIEQLPREIGQLSCLKMLDLNNCYKLKFIPANVISSLSRLEELYMGNTFIQWDNEGSNTARRNASLHELKHLSRLTNLEIHIKDARIIPGGFFSKKLERYKIYIGDGWVWSQKYEGTRTLKLKVNTNVRVEDEVTMQLREIEVLYLDELQGTDNVLCKMDEEGFPQLKHLLVQNNPYVLCILDSMEWLPQEAFPQLESLFLSNLIKMEKICYGQLTAKSFCKLNILKVDKCDKLKNIFSLSMVESLPQLKTMEVAKCKVMEEVFEVGRKDDVNNNEVSGKIELGQIQFLTLKALPQLNSFCSKTKIPSMALREVPKDIEVVLEDPPTTLFNEMVLLPKLEALEVSAINCEKIWQNQPSAISSCFQNITSLIVQGCGNLKYIFSSSIVRSFLKLQHLEICRCPLLKEILVMDSSREEERKSIIFPQLNFLKLEDLENLNRFCLEYGVEFTSLKQLEIKQCPKFRAIVLENMSTNFTTDKEVGQMSLLELHTFFNEKVAFPELEEMVISNLSNLKMIWDNKLAHHSFRKLKLIKIEDCNELVTLFPSNMFKRFFEIESLTINNCGLLEEIFGIQELDFEETHSPVIIQLKQVSVSNCGILKNIFEATIAKSLLQLEKLEVRSCKVLTEIVAMEAEAKTVTVRFVFPKLSHLKLSFLPKLITFYPGVHTLEWQVLKHLVVADCENLKTFDLEMLDLGNTKDEGQLIPVQQPFFLVEKVIPRLRLLELNIKDIIMICHGQSARHHFSKLDTLIIRRDEAAVFSPGLLERYPNLKKLTLCYSSYKEIFSHEDVEKHVENFERIISLCLVSLSQLKRVWRQDSKLNSILQNLESLHVEYCDNLINLVPSSASFRNITTLIVYSCEGMVGLVTSSTAKSLQQLERMTIEGCKRMTEIVANEGDVGEDEIVLSKLEHLLLVGLESLTSFCSMNYSFNFPSLVVLIVRDCPKMKIFCGGAVSTSKLQMVCQNREWRLDKGCWEGDLNTTIQQLHIKMVELRNLENMEASATDFEKIWRNQCSKMASRFQNLKRLFIQGNGKLTFLFSSSIVRSFLQLQQLEICKCPALNVVVAIEESREEEEERNSIMFPQLNFLKIEDVENLTGFCLENYVEFPSLKQLEINQCPEFKAFVLQNSSTHFAIAGEVEKMNSMEIQPFFNDKVSFPELEEMRISNLDNLKMIWDNKLAHLSFRKLKLIEVEGCNKLVTLSSSSMFRRFTGLESLIINKCGSLEEIFGLQELDLEEAHSPFIIRLKQVTVSNCGSLKNIFQASIAKSLLQLEKLEVKSCKELTAIVAMEQEAQTSTVRFAFPKVSRLVLSFLPKLVTFYPGVHTLEWQVLEHLVVADCENVKTFSLEMVEFGNTKDEGQLIPVQHPFLVEKVIPRLKFLELNIKDIIMLCHGQFARLHFSKLDTLFIREDEAAVFSPVLLERYPSLKTLLLCYSSYKEIFSHEDVEEHVENFGRIICLRLESLSQLKRIWRQDSKLNSILQNLEILHVEDCDNLINLVPSSASFRNLTILKVCYCVGLTNLISSSTAKSLESLKQMKIKGCKGMTDIVANEGNAGEDEIVLNKLEELSLVDLESLKSFCSMNYTFRFPSLDVLIVRDCPKMKIFCEGNVSTSKLTMVCQSREDWKLDKGYWKDDLSTTIQQLQHNMVELRNLESMDVSATDFEKICQNQCPEMTSRFQNLKRLVVKGSGNLTYLFSSYTVRSFLQLQHLEICKCPAVHEIIAMEELRKEERKDIIFPQLNFLKIEDLENLTRFCLENYVEFPALKQLEIKQCPNFKAFVLNNYIDLTTAGETRKMSSMDIQAFFNDKVALPDLEEMVLSHLDNLKMIWDNKLANHSFNKQKSVKVEGCDKLLILFPSSILGRLSRLKSLTVDNCGSLEVIFGIQESNFEETHSMLDLKLMSVTKCQNLKIIFPTTVARSLLQLEDLEIIDCGILEEIVSKEGRGEASAVKFFFPKVARLVLKDLPALTNFYPGVHTSEWPMLEVLVVYGCEKVKVVALEYLYCQKAKDESHLDIPAKQPLLLFEKIIPRLEVLGLSGQEIMKILYGQFPRHLFSKIKDLGIREDESAVFPLGLFEKFYRLEKLKLRHGSYKELFSNGDVEKHVGSLAGIKELLLESLSEMKHLWKQDAKLNLVLQHLEILEVEKCNSLVSLLPPSAFLSNLTTLKVCYCNGMVNLATSLTAKSLQHLRNISIEGCKRMAEIVANEGDEAEDEIVFNKLEELSLVGLESLISFCSMNCTFNFPSLDVLIVRDCPKMKIFSEGALRISKLEIVCQNREDWFVDKGCWEGDLNTTIQKLHNKMNVQSSEEDSGQPSEHHME